MPQPEQSEEFVRNILNPGALEADLAYQIEGEVRFDAGSRAIYSTDASNYRQIPIGVVIPKTTEAVIKTLEICRRHGAPVVSRGGGTGLCGQTCNVAVVIDHSKYLNKILEIDPDRKLARVQPGVILDHLRDQAEQYHLTFGPDPATHDRNTFGGMIGNNSCGIHSVMAGRTVDNILELDVVTYDGVRLRVGATSEEELGAIIAEGGRRGEIYRGLRDIRDSYARLMRQRYPKIPRRVSGYNLDELLEENGFNVARALVGTEGTCVTVLEATLRLVHSPPARALVLLGYSDIAAAGDHVGEVMHYRPIGLEGIDDLLVIFLKKKGLHPEDVELLPEGNGWLIAEFGGETRAEAEENARSAMAGLRTAQEPPAMKLYSGVEEQQKVWRLRESGLAATANVPGLPLAWPGWEDAAIPPEQIGRYLREFRQLLDSHGLIASLFGHFGDGCIHCNITFDFVTRSGIENFNSFIDKAANLVVKYGGSFSAEHGDGQSKAVFLRKMYGEELLAAFRQFKSLWDPEWKMNPGKVIDPYLPDQNLRLGVDYNPWLSGTHFNFLKDHASFPLASLRCAGVGKCRRTHDAFMCPSFLATREEQHTTRGRARILFEMFRGDFIKDRWRSREVLDALELCLSCKACKIDCPVQVDMAMYKAEFLSHYYRCRLRPLPAYSMGLIGIWGRIGARMPGLANFLTQAPLVKTVTKALGGIAPQRKMPVFSDETFTDWYHRSGYKPRGEHKVVLYPDLFNDCFFPETLKAALQVLERYGYAVAIPEENPPAVRPPIDYGMLVYAKKRIMEAVHLLHPFVREGIPVVFLEPSTAAVFRDELPELFPQHQDGARVTSLSFLLGEFIERERLEPPPLPGSVIFHGHCHQKAVLRIDAARDVLRKMGLKIEEPQPGCCGMAGSFGYENGKYELSMQIAETNLLPAIRKAAVTTYIVADGFSCRTQIMDGSGRKALHMAELLQLAFAKRLDAAEKALPQRTQRGAEEKQ